MAGRILPWVAGQARLPHVFAEFGNRVINISDTPDFQNAAQGLTDFAFPLGLPGEGQGIICLNKTARNDSTAAPTRRILKSKTKKFPKLFKSYQEFIQSSISENNVKNRKFYIIIKDNVNR